MSWREEYVRSFAGWALAGEGGARAPALGGARHAALATDGRLALVSEDAELAVSHIPTD